MGGRELAPRTADGWSTSEALFSLQIKTFAFSIGNDSY